MKRLMLGAVWMLLLTAGSVFADDLTDANGKLKPLTDRITKLSSGKVGENSKTQLATALETVGAVKAALSAHNGPLALQKAELADIQITIAEVTSEEMESSEQLILRRAELKNLEIRFDYLLQTGGK
jgi:hypothetical protein